MTSMGCMNSSMGFNMITGTTEEDDQMQEVRLLMVSPTIVLEEKDQIQEAHLMEVAPRWRLCVGAVTELKPSAWLKIRTFSSLRLLKRRTM